MVCAGNPTSIFPLHASPAYQNVLYRIVQHVPHVQNPGDIGWRNDNGIGFSTVGLRFEKTVFQPIGIPFFFYVGGIVLRGKFVHKVVLSECSILFQDTKVKRLLYQSGAKI